MLSAVLMKACSSTTCTILSATARYIRYCSKLYTHRLDVGGGLGRSLQEDESVLLCEQLSLLGAHRAPVLQVALVPYQHDGHVWVTILSRFFEPSAEVVEALPPGNVVNKQRARSVAVVRTSDRTERFLTGLK